MIKDVSVGIDCHNKVIDINAKSIAKSVLKDLLLKLDGFLDEYVVNVNNTKEQSESLVDSYYGNINIKFLG